MKLVIATDVRFWHRSTGAQRRIFSLVSHLASQDMNITVLFVGSLNDAGNGYTATSERRVIADCPFNVVSLIEDWTPRGLVRRCVWKIQCIANWLRQSRAKNSTSTTHRPQSGSKYLSDFSDPLMAERFQDMVNRIGPDAVIVEYVTLGYLIPKVASANESRTQYLIDTHDLLSERYRQFQKYGFEHWIRITRDEEAAVLAKFDTVIAIQEEEANEFRSMGHEHQTVIVAGYPADSQLASTTNPAVQSHSEFTLGYFGSNNPSNAQAVQWFMSEVWPHVLSKQPKISLLIAGSICEAVSEYGDQSNVVLQRDIPNLVSLYERFKIAINPVQFGTGLKIKNQEALTFGKPLIVTRSGAAGMLTNEHPSPIVVTEDSQQMQQAIIQLAMDEVAIHQASEAAVKYVNDHLGPNMVYQALIEQLRTFPNTDRDSPLSEMQAEL